jgi:hypothetical protein
MLYMGDIATTETTGEYLKMSASGLEIQTTGQSGAYTSLIQTPGWTQIGNALAAGGEGASIIMEEAQFSVGGNDVSGNHYDGSLDSDGEINFYVSNPSGHSKISMDNETCAIDIDATNSSQSSKISLDGDTGAINLAAGGAYFNIDSNIIQLRDGVMNFYLGADSSSNLLSINSTAGNNSYSQSASSTGHSTSMSLGVSGSTYFYQGTNQQQLNTQLDINNSNTILQNPTEFLVSTQAGDYEPYSFEITPTFVTWTTMSDSGTQATSFNHNSSIFYFKTGTTSWVFNSAGIISCSVGGQSKTVWSFANAPSG